MFRIAICEDNKSTLELLAQIVSEKFGEQLQVSTYEEIEDLYDEWNKTGNPSEILLTDIRFGGINGIEAAKMIQKHFRNVKVIFITGYLEYAGSIFEAEPIYFLTKPIEADKVCEAVQKAMDRIGQEDGEVLKLTCKGCAMQLRFKDIRYMESDNKNVHIYETENVWTVSQKLNDMEKELPESFLRCHQSYLVNMKEIKSFSTKEIELFSGERVPISRPKYHASKQKLVDYLKITI